MRQVLLNYTPQKSRNLKPDAVPTEKLPIGFEKINPSRTIRLVSRNIHKLMDVLLSQATMDVTDSVPEESVNENAVCGDGLQIDLTQTINELRDEIRIWKRKYSELFRESAIRRTTEEVNDNDKNAK